MSFKEGDLVFCFHPKHSWVVGKVTSSAGKAPYQCKVEDPRRGVASDTLDKLKEEQLTTCRDDLLEEEVDDLLQLTVLHDATLLRCLFIRYMANTIYTNIGAIVVALNPFNFSIPKYMDAKMPDYLCEGDKIEKNVPHSWAQAHNTYFEMVSDKGDQCILISGESGAGKTEAAKIVMKYLAQISARRGTEEEKKAGLLVGDKLSMCSPVLEAFGNAKTTRNDNSSRFGKFMKVKFTLDGKLVGAYVTKYLLEKSRIITCGVGERVYHSFYAVCRGKSLGFRLSPDKDYKSLRDFKGVVSPNSEFNTEKDFEGVMASMRNIGMQEDQMKSVWSLVAGVISIVNVEFKGSKEDGSKVDEATFPWLTQAVNFWKVDPNATLSELCTTTFEIKGTSTTIKLEPVKCIDGRDACCKALYDSCFQWIVDQCNKTCDVGDTGGNWIGLLDIFGFEDFEKNSFEQICINLANETLQNHYNTYIFSKDMDECRAEGIDVTEIKCPDNEPCLILVTGKMGIMDMLDEECSLGQGSDLAFLEKVSKQHNKNPFFAFNQLAKKPSFIVKHYAGDVSYEVDGWLEKNRDTLKDALKLLVIASDDALIKTLLPAPLTVEQKKGKAPTVGGFFKLQVQALMKVINNTNPHWIRCVKPHPAKKPLMFDGITTMNQLESSGVLGTVKIRKAGYPIRIDFAKFGKRYAIMANASGGAAPAAPAPAPAGKAGGKGAVAAVAAEPPSIDYRKSALAILTFCGIGNDPKMAQIGKTKVFLKSEAYPVLERKRGELLMKYILTVERWGQGLLCRMRQNRPYWEMKWGNAAMIVQKEYRDYVHRSSSIRAERAKAKRELEERVAAATSGLLREETLAREAIWEDSGPRDYALFKNQLNALIEEEKEKLELTKGERQELGDKEYADRVALYNEFAQQGADLAQMRVTEVMVWAEIELFSLGGNEYEMRDRVWEEEQESLRTLKAKITVTQSILMLVQIQFTEDRRRQGVHAMEVLCRGEMKARSRLMLKEREVKRETHEIINHSRETVALQQRRRHKMIRRKERDIAALQDMRSSEMHRVLYGEDLEEQREAQQQHVSAGDRYVQSVYASEARRAEQLRSIQGQGGSAVAALLSHYQSQSPQSQHGGGSASNASSQRRQTWGA